MNSQIVHESQPSKEKMSFEELLVIWSGAYLQKFETEWIPKSGYEKYYKKHGDNWYAEILNAEIINERDDVLHTRNEEFLGLQLNDCTITYSFNVCNINIKGGVGFSNCKIKRGVSIYRCTIDGYFGITSSSVSSVNIKDCTINGTLTFTNESDAFYYNLESCKILNFIEFRNVKIANNLSIKDSLLYEELLVWNNELIKHLSISKLTIKSGLYIINNNSNSLHIHDCKIYKHANLSNLTIDKEFLIENTVFSDQVKIINSIIKVKININKSNFYDALILENNNIDNSFEVLDCNFKKEINLMDGALRKINIRGNSFINIFNFKQTSPSTINLIYIKINKVLFVETVSHKDTVINILGCTVQKVIFNAFVNSGYIMFNNIKASTKFYRMLWNNRSRADVSWNAKDSNRSIFSIINSDAGKAQFVDCNLRAFNRFEFSSSKMVDIFVAGTVMPDSITVPSSRKTSELAEQRLGYAQLKRIHENRGDSVTALEYLAKELTAYRKSLRSTKGTKAERFNLWLNEISNDYNTNYTKAFRQTLVVLAVCYTAYCWMIGYSFGSNWTLLGELTSRMFEFLNPVRRSDFLVEKGSPDFPDAIPYYARIWDYISRVIISYFAYQTIQAFRKHGKK